MKKHYNALIHIHETFCRVNTHSIHPLELFELNMQFSTAIKTSETNYSRSRDENFNLRPKITKNPIEFDSTELKKYLLENRVIPVTKTYDPEMLNDINMNPMMEESNTACISSPESAEYQQTAYTEIVMFFIEDEKADGKFICGMDAVYFSKLKNKISSDGTPRFCRFELSRIQKTIEDLKIIIYVEEQKKYEAEVQQFLLKSEPHANLIKTCSTGLLDDLTINQILMQDILLNDFSREQGSSDNEYSETEGTDDEYDAQLYPARDVHADYFKNYNTVVE